MNHFQRFLGEGGDLRKLVLLALGSGLASALMLALLNNAVNLAAADKVASWWEYTLFAMAFTAYFVATKLSLQGADALIERLLKNLRIRLADKIRQSDLIVVEELGRGNLFTSLSQSTSQLSKIFPLLVNALQELIIVGFCFFYIGYLSLIAFAVLLVVTLLAIRQFQISRSLSQLQYQQRHEGEAELLDSLGHIVDGFKEIRLNERKRSAIFSMFSQLTENLRELAYGIAEAQVSLFLLSTSFLYLTLAGLVYVLPQYLDVDVFKLCTALLFCVGPLSGVIGLLPLLSTAEAGLRSIYDLEANLDASLQPAREAFAFQILSYQGLTFGYGDEFRSGPWSITLRRGEIVFLVGGTGSGKSTALKLLSGLYESESGAIRVDDRILSRADRAALRELFSCVFTDFYLFDRLYGCEDADPVRLLREMGLEGKVRFEDGRFSTLALSSGQRKRLALIVALLDDKPIYVFDEWTSDQDAHFRDYFYHQVLPDLKRRGKTVVCATHDDRYWSTADRVIRFELGRIVEQREGEASA